MAVWTNLDGSREVRRADLPEGFETGTTVVVLSAAELRYLDKCARRYESSRVRIDRASAADAKRRLFGAKEKRHG